MKGTKEGGWRTKGCHCGSPSRRDSDTMTKRGRRGSRVLLEAPVSDGSQKAEESKTRTWLWTLGTAHGVREELVWRLSV